MRGVTSRRDEVKTTVLTMCIRTGGHRRCFDEVIGSNHSQTNLIKLFLSPLKHIATSYPRAKPV